MARSHNNDEQNVRLLKVGERVRHVLSEILMRGQVHDEMISTHNVSVTEVRMSSDMRIAKVFVKPLLGEDEEAVLTALQQNTAYFQREVASALKLKYAAKLRFLADESFDEANRIEQLLNDPLVVRDLKDEEE